MQKGGASEQPSLSAWETWGRRVERISRQELWKPLQTSMCVKEKWNVKPFQWELQQHLQVRHTLQNCPCHKLELRNSSRAFCMQPSHLQLLRHKAGGQGGRAACGRKEGSSPLWGRQRLQRSPTWLGVWITSNSLTNCKETKSASNKLRISKYFTTSWQHSSRCPISEVTQSKTHHNFISIPCNFSYIVARKEFPNE